MWSCCEVISYFYRWSLYCPLLLYLIAWINLIDSFPLCSVLAFHASFFLAEPGDKLASEVFYIFQMACDLNCTAEGICWDHIIYYQIMRSEMKAYIYKIFILLTLRKSKCSQLHLWQVRFCFVLSSLHLYSINSEHPVLALAKTVAVALLVYQMQKFGLSSASADYQISYYYKN